MSAVIYASTILLVLLTSALAHECPGIPNTQRPECSLGCQPASPNEGPRLSLDLLQGNGTYSSCIGMRHTSQGCNVTVNGNLIVLGSLSAGDKLIEELRRSNEQQANHIETLEQQLANATESIASLRSNLEGLLHVVSNISAAIKGYGNQLEFIRGRVSAANDSLFELRNKVSDNFKRSQEDASNTIFENVTRKLLVAWHGAVHNVHNFGVDPDIAMALQSPTGCVENSCDAAVYTRRFFP